MNNYNTIFNEILKKYGNSEKWSGNRYKLWFKGCIKSIQQLKKHSQITALFLIKFSSYCM